MIDIQLLMLCGILCSCELTRIIHGISFMQMRGVETRRNTLVFQGFCNEADA